MLLAIVGVGLGLVLYFTPVMSARNIVVTGIGAVTPRRGPRRGAGAARNAAAADQHRPVADRVAAIRRVASARVQRQYPSALRITIVERVPVVVKDFPDGPHLFDRDGVDFATAPPPPALPYLDVDRPRADRPGDQGGAGGAARVASRGRRQVGRIAAPSVASITLTLAMVEW